MSPLNSWQTGLGVRQANNILHVKNLWGWFFTIRRSGFGARTQHWLIARNGLSCTTKSAGLSFINRLSPIIDLFFTPWNNKEVLDGISIRKSRQILFDTSEGLNVYEEPVAANELYFDTFSRYHSWDSPRSNIMIFIGCRPRMTLYWCSPPQKKKNSVNFWCPQCCHKQGWLNW